MEMFSSAVVGELVSRSISSLFSKFDKETTVQEDLQRLRHLLLRSGAIIRDAEQRHIPSKAMLQQLKALRDETFRGHYVLDAVRFRDALTGGKDDDGDGDGDDEVGRRRGAFSLSRFNPAKRVRFPSDASAARPVLGGASPVELRQVVRRLEIMIGDMKEFVMFLASYPPLYHQPYSAHMFVGKCMFCRHMEMEMVMDFLLKDDPCGGDPENQKLGVLPIVGPAHVGKSTLVEHVCGDERVRNHFTLILFYSGNDLGDLTVSGFRDKCKIKHKNDNASEERLLAVIEVLEDVDDETWNRLYSSQRSIAQGSKMIMTSRSDRIQRLGTAPALMLKCLPLEAYWYFFRAAAFGSEDPGQHPKMASLALEMATMIQGSFLFAYIGSALLREHFDAKMWHRVVTRLKQYLEKNVSMIGKYHDEVKADHPRFTWSLVTLQPNKYFVVHDICQRGSAQDEVPKISFLDLLGGNNDQPRGKYEILMWKSQIPPYFNYTATCEARDM